MQESRQFKILYHLLNKGHATAPELAEKQDIVTALQSVTAADPIWESDILEKLSALFRVPSENWFEVDFSRWGGENRDNEKFELLKWAVLHRKCVRITYAGSSETISERIIQPLKLSYKARAWYVKAYCVEKQDYRIFKLTRILELDLLEEGFAPQSFVERENSEQAIPEAENPPRQKRNSPRPLIFPETRKRKKPTGNEIKISVTFTSTFTSGINSCSTGFNRTRAGRPGHLSRNLITGKPMGT